MEVTAESLRERYSSMNSEALADLYHGGLTELAVSVLKEVITSRGLDWTEFITPLPTEPESIADWELWKSESTKSTKESDGNGIGPRHSGVLLNLFRLSIAIWGLYIISVEAIEIYRIGNWQSVDGKIEYVSREGGGREGIDLDVTYSYKVGQNTYWGAHSEWFIMLPPPSYKRTMPITVFYDEASPSNSIADLGAGYRFAEIAKGLMMFGLGVLLSVTGSTEGRRESSARSNSSPGAP